MTLAGGTRLGPYEILSAIGAGGMGEVYKARDSRLDRTVAIKVLASDVSSTPEQRLRFEREARTISKLSHPHICSLHDVGREGEIEYLVMEYLEGETLSQRLARGPLPVEQTLRFGSQIAEALDRAHREGIVHRDLKPANVMLTKSGVKLLDFGLAKAVAPDSGSSSLTSMPTAAQRSELTQEGALLGTVPYMAPEQLEGREADARTDIFALGATLYEMATGRRAFSGQSRASVISSILRDEPRPVSQVESMSPPALDRIVGTCLAKDPEERWHSAHDVGFQLREVARSLRTEPAAPAGPARASGRIRLLGAAVLLAALAWAAGRYFGTATAPRRTRRLSVLPPEKATMVLQEAPALSPDGSRLAFVALDSSGKSLLYVRPLDSPDAAVLADTEGASMPFWSPDGRSLGFFSRGKLKTIDAAGGHSQTLADASVARGGTWNAQGTILFVPSPPEAPRVIPASGGEARPVPQQEPPGVGPYRRSPHFLPDGRHYLYLQYNRSPELNAIYVGSLDSRESRRLVSSQSSAAYAAPGYLIFRRESALMAQRFDPKKLELRGAPFPIVPDIGFNPITLQTLFSAANEGTLAYVEAGATKTQMTWFGRDGRELGRVGPPGYYNSLSLSADGRRLVYDQASPGGDLDIWTLELERGVASRFTFDPAVDFFPVCSPDGNRVVFSSLRGLPPSLFQKMVSGSAAEEPLLRPERPRIPASWSRDGRFLVYGELRPKTKWDIWVLPMTGDRKPFPFVASDAIDLGGEISPDGRWMAYMSDESGSPEVYVRPFPTGSGKWQVSRDGGYEPHWGRDGKELFYVSSDRRLTAVAVKPDPASFEAGVSTPLFTSRMAGIDLPWNRYAVDGDGRRFLFDTIGAGVNASILVSLDWDAGAPK